MDSLLVPAAQTRLVKAASQPPRSCPAAGRNMNDTAGIERLGKLKKSCADIESLFLSTLFKAMRKTVPQGGLFKKSSGDDIYDSMFDQQVSVSLSQGRGIGLGQMLYNQMLRKEDLEGLQAQNRNFMGLRYQTSIPPALLNQTGLSTGDRPAKETLKQHFGPAEGPTAAPAHERGY